MGLWILIGLFVVWCIGSTIKVNKEWEEAVILRFGKFKRIKKAGIYLKIPFAESVFKRDLRTQTLDIAEQKVITKDNISVGVDAVMWFKVIDTKKSVMKIKDVHYSVKQFAQTSLRNIVGKKELDELLSKREEVASEIEKILDEASEEWGIDIERVELQNIVLPENMKRIMARQAEAEREKRAVIIKAEGELEAARNLKKASNILAKSRFGLQLRQLATIADVSQDQSNTIIFVPTEALNSPILSTGVSAKVPPPKM